MYILSIDGLLFLSQGVTLIPFSSGLVLLRLLLLFILLFVLFVDVDVNVLDSISIISFNDDVGGGGGGDEAISSTSYKLVVAVFNFSVAMRFCVVLFDGCGRFCDDLLFVVEPIEDKSV
jgi:hypothetical protein